MSLEGIEWCDVGWKSLELEQWKQGMGFNSAETYVRCSCWRPSTRSYALLAICVILSTMEIAHGY